MDEAKSADSLRPGAITPDLCKPKNSLVSRSGNEGQMGSSFAEPVGTRSPLAKRTNKAASWHADAAKDRTRKKNSAGRSIPNKTSPFPGRHELREEFISKESTGQHHPHEQPSTFTVQPSQEKKNHRERKKTKTIKSD